MLSSAPIKEEVDEESDPGSDGLSGKTVSIWSYYSETDLADQLKDKEKEE